MRTISLVDKIEFEFVGTIFHEALAFGDADNDFLGELVVGNTDGDMTIFKGTLKEYWKKSTGLGMITCIGIGDVRHRGQNDVVAMTAEGQCHFFQLDSVSISKATPPSDSRSNLIKPTLIHCVPANSKSMILADIDGDGRVEVVVAYSDRVVQSFKWTSTKGDFGELQLFEKWQLVGQVGALTVNRCADDSLELIASQPGATYVSLLTAKSRQKFQQRENQNPELLDYDIPTLVYHPLTSSKFNSSSVTTEIVGCLNWSTSQKPDKSFQALTTLDGLILIVQNDVIIWSMQVDHQLFSTSKLDLTESGKDEVVICSWDGCTYFIDSNTDVVKYQFEENVAAFHCGMYSIDGKVNKPCLVYGTFNDRLDLFYNLDLKSFKLHSLYHIPRVERITRPFLDSLGINDSLSGKRDLINWTLYGSNWT